jgi:predicted membrane protein
MSEEFENRSKTRWEERRKRWEERKERWESRRSGDSHVWTGVFILLIGVAALLRTTMEGLPAWLFTWPMFLVALGLFIGLKHRFRGAAWFILMLVGGAFLYNKINPDIEIRQYIWPAVLILVGGMLIIRPRRCYNREKTDDQKKNSPEVVFDVTAGVEEPYSSHTDYNEDFVDSTSFFGGAKKNIISKNFKGGDLVNIFGGTELDLTRADFNGTATIELTTIFGGTKLIVPSNWTVKSEAVTIFGGLEDKRNSQTLIDNPGKVLLLKGTVIFGGIEIKSF